MVFKSASTALCFLSIFNVVLLSWYSEATSDPNARGIRTNPRWRHPFYRGRTRNNDCKMHHICENTTYVLTNTQSTVDIKSPGYPYEYCNSMDCETLVETDSDSNTESVTLQFHHVELENLHDFVEVYQISPKDDDDPVFMYRLTGTAESRIPTYTDKNSALKVVFTSDSSVIGRGFSASASKSNCSCGQLVYELDSSDVIIRGPPTDQPDCRRLTLGRCYYFVKMKNPDDEDKYVVHYDVTSANAKESDSADRPETFLKFYEGEAGMIRGVRRLLNVVNKDTDTTNPSLSNKTRSSSMMIEYIGFIGQDTFNLRVNKVINDCKCPSNPFTESNGIFKSPGYPSEFCSKLNCWYNFTAPEGKRVQLHFATFDLLAAADWIMIYGDNETYDQPIFTKTGTVAADEIFSFTSNGKDLKMKLITQNQMGSQGFYGRVTFVDKITDPGCECPSPQPYELQESSAEIAGPSPSKPGVCGPIDCIYYIKKPQKNNDKLLLDVRWKGSASVFDYIDVYKDKPNYMQQLQFHYNGHLNTDPFDSFAVERFSSPFPMDESLVLNSSQRVMIHYHSMNGANADWNITYQWKSKCNCNAEATELQATDSAQVLTSPGFPVAYCNLLACSWKITADKGHQVFLEIETFYTEQTHDKLEIFNHSTGTGKRIQSLSGLQTVPIFVSSEGNEIFLNFSTDTSISHKGFKLLYSQKRLQQETTTVTSTAATKPSTRTTTAAPSGQTSTSPASTTVKAGVVEPKHQTYKVKGGVSLWAVVVPLLVIAIVLVAVVTFWRKKGNPFLRMWRSNSPVVGFHAGSSSGYKNMSNNDNEILVDMNDDDIM